MDKGCGCGDRLHNRMGGTGGPAAYSRGATSKGTFAWNASREKGSSHVTTNARHEGDARLTHRIDRGRRY